MSKSFISNILYHLAFPFTCNISFGIDITILLLCFIDVCFNSHLLYVYEHITAITELTAFILLQAINECWSEMNKNDSFLSERIWYFHKWKITSRCYFHYSFRNTSVVFFVSLTVAGTASGFLSPLFFSVFLVNLRNILETRLFHLPFQRSTCFKSIERGRHDVHVLFGGVSYDVRSAHWRVNNKIKRKFTLFSLNTIKKNYGFHWKKSKFSFFFSCNENIHIFTRASLRIL